VLFGDGSGQATLDKIIGAYHVPGQRPPHSGAPWNFRFEQRAKSFIGSLIPRFAPLSGSTIEDG